MRRHSGIPVATSRLLRSRCTHRAPPSTLTTRKVLTEYTQSDACHEAGECTLSTNTLRSPLRKR
jgi:hypothetical protein